MARFGEFGAKKGVFIILDKACAGIRRFYILRFGIYFGWLQHHPFLCWTCFIRTLIKLKVVYYIFLTTSLHVKYKAKFQSRLRRNSVAHCMAGAAMILFFRLIVQPHLPSSSVTRRVKFCFLFGWLKREKNYNKLPNKLNLCGRSGHKNLNCEPPNQVL